MEKMATDINSGENRQFRLAGEDAPLWPAAAFCLFGAALAFAASAQILAPPAAPAPAIISVAAAIPTPAPVAVTKLAVCLPIVSIPFDLNSARLNTTGLDTAVTPLQAWLVVHKQAVLSVEGHADPRGDEAANVVLSYKRAKATVAWLTQAGVAADQIALRAAGAPSRQTADAASNRHVVLQIEGVEPCRDDGAPEQNP
jgi:outer membrane protein OmpA-like peptidoglycan-associated protein